MSELRSCIPESETGVALQTVFQVTASSDIATVYVSLLSPCSQPARMFLVLPRSNSTKALPVVKTLVMSDFQPAPRFAATPSLSFQVRVTPEVWAAASPESTLGVPPGPGPGGSAHDVRSVRSDAVTARRNVKRSAADECEMVRVANQRESVEKVMDSPE